MVRPFHIRDTSLLQRLSPLGRSLAFEAVAVEGINPLREAVRAYMSPGPDREITLVHRGESDDAFLLMHILQKPDKEADAMGCAALMYMAPDPNSDERVESWMALIEHASAVAAGRGVGTLIAEAPESSGEAEALGGAGFMPWVRMDALKLATIANGIAPSDVPGLRGQNVKDEKDDALVKWLAHRVVPKPLQRADTTSDLTRVMHEPSWGYLLMKDNEALGHISIGHGKRAFGVQLLMRPEAESLAPDAIRAVLSERCLKSGKPAYLMLPAYQSWLLPILDDLSFTHITTTVLMTRHVTASVRQPVWSHSATANHGKLARSGDRIETAPSANGNVCPSKRAPNAQRCSDQSAREPAAATAEAGLLEHRQPAT